MVVLEPYGRIAESGYCYVCHGTKLITDFHSSELICANCGLVISEKEDYEGTENLSNSLSVTHSASALRPCGILVEMRMDICWIYLRVQK